MKTIVVPTDFSPSADNALNFAMQIAQRVNCDVLLVHVYQVPISMNDMPVLTVSADEIKTNAEVALAAARDTAAAGFPGVSIRTDTRLGDVADELDEYCRTGDIYAVVVGKHGMSGVERMIFGSTTLSVIRHCSAPVIAVPEGSGFHLRNAALAIDLLDNMEMPQDRLYGLLRDLGLNLHIIHVKTKKEEDASAEMKKVLPQMQPRYHIIHDDNFVNGINSFIEQNEIDLLITLPHKHTLIERLFFRTHTNELIKEVQIPIMSIREK